MKYGFDNPDDEWVQERIWGLFDEERKRRPRARSLSLWRAAFARYVVQHEEPPGQVTATNMETIMGQGND